MVKKKNKKGRGAEKTAQKMAKKSKKEEGMEDLEAMIAEFKQMDKKKTEFYEEKCNKPSPRCNLTVSVHPEKDELLFFGGEYDTGHKTYVYNDLFAYSIKKNEWTQQFVPNPPPRRCAHQAITLARDGGQMWVFGGEFASPTHSKFYHYKDLWVLGFKSKTWEQVNVPGGPSARSGHRMIGFKKQFLVFGGFHESSTNFVYFNDLHSFDLTAYQWSKLTPNGNGPSPRSACHLLPTSTGVLILGGYSKVKLKKDVDKGTAHDDMFLLEPETLPKEGPVIKWKWGKVKESGEKPSSRSSYGITPIGGNRAVMFGGVFDEDEDDEINSVFYNTMHCLDLSSFRWFPFKLRQGRTGKPGKKDKVDAVAGNGDEENAPENDCEESEIPETADKEKNLVWVPCGRMNPLIVAKGGYLYLYGGAFEEDDKQVTLNDLWSLNLKNPTTWNQVFESDDTSKDWHESDSSSSDEEGKADEACGAEDEECDSKQHPNVVLHESFDCYWARTSEHWLELMSDAADEDTPADKIREAAEDMARANYKLGKKEMKRKMEKEKTDS